MSYSKRNYETVMSSEEFAQREELVILIQAYQAVRSIPGPARNRAEKDLGNALAWYGRSFIHGEWAWWWSWEQDSIMRQRAVVARVMGTQPGTWDETVADVPQSSRRQVGRGNWTTKGRAI